MKQVLRRLSALVFEGSWIPVAPTRWEITAFEIRAIRATHFRRPES